MKRINGIIDHLCNEITKLKSQNVFSELDIMRLDKDAMIEKMQAIINKVPEKFYADILYDKIS